jgi:very-short-patch-repair endonuclease
MDPDARLLRLAARQHSAFTHAQALAAGIASSTIHRRISNERWIRIHRGVYLPASVRVERLQILAAALLAAGAKAVLSHRSAGTLLGLIELFSVPELTIPHGTSCRQRGLIVYRAACLDRARYEGFPVTNPMRTIIDLAALVSEETVERAIDNAHRRGLVRPDRFADYLALPRNLNRPGSGVVRKIVHLRDPRTPLGSDLETLFFRLLRRSGLPLPLAQLSVQTRRGERRIDFAYPEEHLAIELDGWAEHSSRQAFVADRTRQNDLELLGWHVLRFTWDEVRNDPTGVTIGTALGLAPSRWRSVRL